MENICDSCLIFGTVDWSTKQTNRLVLRKSFLTDLTNNN